MQFDVKAENLGAVVDLIAKMSGEQMRQAHAAALNDVGFQVRRDWQAELSSVFDRPTPFIVRSPKVLKARPDSLNVAILPTMHSENTWSRGGKVGVDPQDVLQAQEWGGTRRDKKSEAVLRRAGLLPAGYQTAIPRDPYPGSDDGRGNIKGSFMQQLLSYLQLYGEQGYRANMGAAKRQLVNSYGRSRISKNARQQPGPHMGRRYFVARPGGRLQPGVWAAMAGGVVRPVIIFTRAAHYTPRISAERVATRTDRAEYFERCLRYQIRELMRV